MDGTEIGNLMTEGLMQGFAEAIPIVAPIILLGLGIMILRILFNKKKR